MVFPESKDVNFSVPFQWIEQIEKDASQGIASVPPCATRDTLLQDFLDSVTKDSSNVEAWERMTRAWVKDRPLDAEAWFALGHALALRLHEPSFSPTESKERKLLEEGIQVNSKAVELNPLHARAWNNLGVARDLEGKFDLAVAAFERAIHLKPDYGLAWLNLGSAHFNRRDFAHAAEAFRKGLELLPADAHSWELLAHTEVIMGKPAQAMDHFRIALRYKPLDANLWLEYGQCCIKAGDVDTARTVLERLRNLEAPQAKEMEKRLSKH